MKNMIIRTLILLLFNAMTFSNTFVLAKNENALGTEESIRQQVRELSRSAERLRMEERFGESEPLYRQALALVCRSNVGEDFETAAVLGNLGELCRAQNLVEQAESLCRHALSILGNRPVTNEFTVATMLNNLSQLYVAKADYQKAETTYLRCFDIWRTVLGSRRQYYAAVLNNLGERYCIQGGT